ncbi:chromosome segregation and condensation protein ScpA [Geotalea daltonii FRC-32]|uniref:Segregation and condensation protein A n=1 Tax=Geotalea daltonii (strain DSM 22248 / JCM 15807 / FRC-32) TaxID=316067 RepID=B9M312_GEODF|nr:segregation/condensation protein A [Geotalea daltonii]ACM21358.1 chromosome segregation and condensation protein ScpA [Geotalea daltonii FRC-32]
MEVMTENSLFPTDVSYQVNIEEFEGPLDLLLHLIKKNEVDIYNIPIAAITRQYLDYIDLLKDLNLDIAGEFLVMAATLLQIKSKMLLPVTVEEESEEAEEDPRAELVRRLLEYQKYKEAATTLGQCELLGRDLFARKFPAPELASFEAEEEPADVELFELIEAFQRVLAKISPDSFHEVGADGLSIADRITEVLALLEGEEAITFEALFIGDVTRDALVITFLAVLELCKLKMIRITQVKEKGTIWIMPAVADGADEPEEVEEGNAHVGES